MLQATGYRLSHIGRLHYYRGLSGSYWGSSEYTSGVNAWFLYFDSGYADTNDSYRLYGFSVRCISE
jgi:hypothetical protein